MGREGERNWSVPGVSGKRVGSEGSDWAIGHDDRADGAVGWRDGFWIRLRLKRARAVYSLVVMLAG